MLQSLLEPKSIAVIGASDDVTKPGGRLTLNILTKDLPATCTLSTPKAD